MPRAVSQSGPRVPQAEVIRKAPAITGRALLLGAVLIPLDIFWLHQLEIVWYTSEPTTISLYFHVIFTILALMCANLLVRRVRPAWALRQGELLIIYIMLAVSNSLAGHDQLEILVPMLGESTWFASKENRWDELFGSGLPNWLVVKDQHALQGFYEGGVSLYARDNLLAWLTPLAVWTGFIIVLFTVMLAINVILRKQWTEQERLTYPIAQIPMEITDPRGTMWLSHLFWIGFAAAFLIDTLNGFAFLFPALPSIPTRSQHVSFANWPLSATGGFTVAFYPFAIGLGYLLPVDLLFSSWFFYWFWKTQYLLTAVLGYWDRPNFPYVTEQAFGGYMGICVFSLYMARRHFAHVVRVAFGRGSASADADNPTTYRLALAALIIGSGLLIAFATKLGLPAWAAVMFFAIYFALSTAVTRMRAELGPPAHDLHYGGPDSMMPLVFGTTAFGTRGLTFLSLTWWMNRAFRSHPMPHQLEGMRIAERRGLESGRLLIGIMLACIVGIIASFWSLLFSGYHYGWSTSNTGLAAHVFGREPYDRLASWLRSPTYLNLTAAGAVGAGLAFSLALLVMRTTFIWWPLHPVGYAVSSSWSMNLLWMPLLIAWVIKLNLLRYGGLRLYRQALPLFMGLVLGEYVAGGLWALAGVVLQRPVWVFWPY
jgi:hypothetical protein